MISIENIQTSGWEVAIRGMRNPLDSWSKSDSEYKDGYYTIGENDLTLMKKLAKAGSTHAKYRRMINVTFDVIAPLYLYKEFDTYKVGTVCNSCSTMHKIQSKAFTLDDFSHEHLYDENLVVLANTVEALNKARLKYLETKNKDDWWQMIQLLPSTYNQRRTYQMNYEVLAAIYRDRKDHKLDDWRTFCKMIEALPHSELIIGENTNDTN